MHFLFLVKGKISTLNKNQQKINIKSIVWFKIDMGDQRH